MKRIAVVDDNPQTRELLEAYLRQGGYEPLLASTGKEALARMRSQPPNLVILDLIMPAMDGYQVLAEIRATPGLSELPVVALTSHIQPVTRAQAYAAGFDGFLTKPVRMRELLDYLAKFV